MFPGTSAKVSRSAVVLTLLLLLLNPGPSNASPIGGGGSGTGQAGSRQPGTPQPGTGACPSCTSSVEQLDQRNPSGSGLAGSPELWKFKRLTTPLGGR